LRSANGALPASVIRDFSGVEQATSATANSDTVCPFIGISLGHTSAADNGNYRNMGEPDSIQAFPSRARQIFGCTHHFIIIGMFFLLIFKDSELLVEIVDHLCRGLGKTGFAVNSQLFAQINRRRMPFT
jgi:hypothetical protein